MIIWKSKIYVAESGGGLDTVPIGTVELMPLLPWLEQC